MQRPSYYLVIDVEATCSDDESIPRSESEIIEIGAVLVDGLTFDAIDEFQSFVRPVRHPRLTPFCIELTTIRQIEVEIARHFPDVMRELLIWVRPYHHVLFCSWGKYDRIQFERDCRFHRIRYPFGKSHLDLKSAFAKRQALRHPVGMSTALRSVRLPLRGIHHRGIDDARNIARLLPFIIP
jgi:inhibitor of KinA sporulation pathway (predicted exonuclease)